MRDGSSDGWALQIRLCEVNWQLLLTRLALSCTLLAEGMAMTQACKAAGGALPMTDATLLQRACNAAEPILYPYGRALNAVGRNKVSPLLSGDWETSGNVCGVVPATENTVGTSDVAVSHLLQDLRQPQHKSSSNFS